MTIVTIEDNCAWDSLVDESHHGLIFHKWDFLKAVEKHSGYRLLPYGIYKGDKLICLSPIFCKRELGVKMMFSPPPHSCIPYMGPIMSSTYDTLKQKRKESYLFSSIDEISEALRKISPNYISITLGCGFMDLRPFKWNGYRDESCFTYKLDLTQMIDNIWGGFDATCKKNIKRSEKLGMTLKRVYDPENFFCTMKKRYEEQGLSVPLYSAQYLADLLNAFPDNLKMFYVYLEDKVIALCVNCEYKGRVIHWLGAAKLDNGMAGNDFMLWELIKSAKEAGFKEFEIQGANHKRLSEFKSKFNPQLEIYYSIHKRDQIGRLAEWAYQSFIMKKTLGF